MELDVENYTELHDKVRELKANQRRFQKEKRLITNMKMLIKDTHANGVLSEALKGGNLGGSNENHTPRNLVPGTL